MPGLNIDGFDELFEAGLRCGEGAQSLIPEDAPLTAQQRAWLQGFLCGLFGPRRLAAPSAEYRIDRTRAPSPEHKPHRRYTKENPFAAKVTDVSTLAQRPELVFRFALALEGSGLSCGPCDALGVSPQNDPDTVRVLLRALGARGQESVATQRGTGPVWRALLEELDIQRATPALLELLADVARSKDERARLRSYLGGDPPTEQSVTALLRGFPSARPRPRDLVKVLAPHSPTFYPIAGLGLSDASSLEAIAMAGTATDSDFAHASNFLRDNLRVGSWLPIFIEPSRARLPDDPQAPVVVFACGAGVARARCYLQLRSEAGCRGRNWLFADNRWFDSELTAWHRSEHLTRWDTAETSGAASLGRLIESQGDALWCWIVDHSVLCVCGTDSEIAAVVQSLERVAAKHGRVPLASTHEWFERMSRAGAFRSISSDT